MPKIQREVPGWSIGTAGAEQLNSTILLDDPLTQSVITGRRFRQTETIEM